MTISELIGFKPGKRCRVYPHTGAKQFGHKGGTEVLVIDRREGIVLFFTNGTQADADRCELV